ncbi:MAG: hypothetical protein H8E32_04475 [Nitrospinae bacterium]|nr:hypothetical protein [Nitrospinota bacterium]
MWKNIFLESCLLSALIFGGLYINANYIKDELYENKEKTLTHISGVATPTYHISGEKSEKPNNISGAPFPVSPIVE